MGRPTVEPPPGAAELAALTIHVIVRDFPETLAVLRRAGVDVPARGGDSLAAASADAGPLLDAIEAATAWRHRR
ncbi:MAG TPA: hypothetical protein VF158_03740 [Longimicrobiales bacterium]